MSTGKKPITEIKKLVDSGEINLNSLSHEDLQAIFNEEMEAQFESKTYDMTFLNKVAEALAKTDEPEFSEFWQREYTADDFRKLAAKRSFIDKTPNAYVTSRKNSIGSIKRISIIAASLILVIAMLTLTAYATLPSFNEMMRRMLHMPVGSPIDDSGITYINSGQTKQYLSLDELIEAEKLSDYGIIFPKNLPNELKIISVYYIFSTDGDEFNICFSDENISMNLIVGETIDTTSSSAERIVINGFVVYIDEFNGQYSSMMTYDNNSYYIASTNRNDIITIFEHMNKE